MSYSKLILRDSAEIIWPLDDINDSSSISKPINFFTNNPFSYSASINVNNTNLMKNPIVFGGGTLLSFTSSAIGMSIPALGRFSELYENKDSTLSFWFQLSKINNIESPIFKKRGYENIGLFIKNNYLIFRYGTSASFNQVSVDFVDIKEPHHIVVSRNRSGLMVILDGVTYTNNDGESVRIPKDNNHSNNDYIDFYGPIAGTWNIDTPAFYPNMLNPNIAKRHYVYGLGKNIPDKIFYSRGGNLYNFSTIYSDRLYDINWDYSDEWQFTSLIDLSNDEFGVGPLKLSAPKTYSFDNNINTSSNKYKFSSSAAVTKASYIDIDKLFSKIGGGEYPFFVKFKLDGPLPDKYLSHRLITIGQIAGQEVLKFDLYNDNNTYKVLVSALDFTDKVSFNISNVSSSPSFYIGMKFDNSSTFYFSQSGSSIQTASFSYRSASGFGLDPLVGLFPPQQNSLIRIGSSLNYTDTTFDSNVYGVEQFFGSLERFMVVQPDFSASTNYSYLENYRKSRYEFIFNTQLNRFKIKTYGYGSFNLHSINFSEYIDDNTQIIGGNYISVGYPELESSSVYFYTSLLSYSGSTVYPLTRLKQNNYLGFLNNYNLSDTYLKFNFEIYSEDALYYPERIKYFKMQTFKSKDGSVELKDDAGPKFLIKPSNDSSVYLPEIRYTPSIFMTEESGVKVYNSTSDFTENILPKPLDPRTINGLKLWLDSRFVNGLNNTNPKDDSRILVWTDLSGNNNHAIQNSSASAPVFRSQSLNILRMNQLDGGELDDTSFIIPYNSTIITSPEGAVSGTRGIEITPNGTSINSYIDMSFNTASITVFPNQSYTVVGTIRLLKPQTGSAQHRDARKIIVYTTNGGTEIISASSFAATNSRGTYSLSAVFTTSASTTRARLLFYNGSYDLTDRVYWDNMGVYPATASTSQYSWVQPLTLNDHPVIKFDGKSMSLSSAASVNQPYSLYVVGRNFNNGVFLSYSSSGGLYAKNGFYYIDSGSAIQATTINNEFNVYSILVNSGSSRLYTNGISILLNQYSGQNNIKQITIGKGGIPESYLSGDIASIVVFEGYHDYETRSAVENWLDESFNLIHKILPQNILNDSYTNDYKEWYIDY